ncbi:hypothetical protein OJF2_05790 [Aquisphaera giovannonii]|uniref:Predicted DNA-binding protein ribbon-helix-helix domain-containing protein n=1 Tax=Aquisphaera giovannonii TaxID=406548 RepID=A0A5B9VWM6_9BACT|nr:ribbon-helix-helix domain-containing protein [Aquisphaera giovannonii]QEH32110.1 hypothetical protein OJF2_05790 [Aquisphaera giovannonii]
MDRTSLTRTSFHIRRDQLDALRTHARETGIPASFVIRRGIDLALGGRHRPAGREAAPPRGDEGGEDARGTPPGSAGPGAGAPSA